MIQISKIETPEQMAEAFEIRRIVFVIEQECPPDEEYDEHEPRCTHYLAKFNGLIVGTCRIRTTENGKKLERFAVLKEFRGKYVGESLVKNCLKVLEDFDGKVYLHAQEHALGFYKKLGFIAEGERFYEAGIPHFKMTYRQV